MQDFGIQENFAFKIRSLGLEIQNSSKKKPESLLRMKSGIQFPLTKNPEFSTGMRNPESVAWNPKSKPVLDYVTWSDNRLQGSGS